jgi:hypothetical protein
LVTAAGGVTGAALLLSTPPGVFSRIVPFLLAAAAVGLIIQPRLTAWRERRNVGQSRFLLPAGLFAVTLYNGYFGAGAGVMTLALLLITVDQHMARANALKNMLVGAASVISAGVFVLFGSVRWAACAPMALGLFVGSTIGPRIARHVPPGAIRWLAALAGLGLAVRLWVVPA